MSGRIIAANASYPRRDSQPRTPNLQLPPPRLSASPAPALDLLVVLPACARKHQELSGGFQHLLFAKLLCTYATSAVRNLCKKQFQRVMFEHESHARKIRGNRSGS
jgi:hypothetical protein